MFAAAHVAPDAMTARFGSALGKNNGGWLAFVYAAALLVVGYALIERARRVPWIAIARCDRSPCSDGGASPAT